MKETLVKLILRLLAGVSAYQWRKALEYVSNAAQTAMGSAEKKSWVVESLRAVYHKAV